MVHSTNNTQRVVLVDSVFVVSGIAGVVSRNTKPLSSEKFGLSEFYSVVNPEFSDREAVENGWGTTNCDLETTVVVGFDVFADWYGCRANIFTGASGVFGGVGLNTVDICVHGLGCVSVGIFHHNHFVVEVGPFGS